jgi:transposase InsO family protein
MRFRCIEDHRDTWPVQVLCDALEVSPSGYYAWRGRPESARAAANRALLADIRRVHEQHRRRYGAPRIHAALRAEGRSVSRGRIERLMRLHGIRAAKGRRFRVVTTDSNHALPVASNLLEQNFSATRPNQIWLADITYIPTDEGWLYLAVVLDLFSRKVVGWAMRDHLRQELTIAALTMAIQRQRLAYIEGYYNRQRLHSALGYLTPEQAELQAA